MTETPLQILHSCGLHPGHHLTLTQAAKGARCIIRDLRADLSNPPHDIQCIVLKKLGVEGFTEGGPATHKLVPITEP